MRPLELTIDGFRSYSKEQSFSFEGRSLFGIVGPTGAGKSSILDALIYGLYGKTPRLQRDTRKLVHSASELARIQLLFEAGGEAWEVSRLIRREGASQVRLVRHSDGHLDSTGERQVNERIAEIVGLDYDAFCTSVTLPQGEFDRFLTAPPGDRIKILKRIFRLERIDKMREAARERLAESQLELGTLNARIASLPEDPATVAIELERRLDEARTQVDTLSAVVKEVAEVDKLLAEAAVSFARARAAADELEQISKTLPEPDELQNLVENEQSAHREFEAAEEAITNARDRLVVCEQALSEAEMELGGPALVEATALLKERGSHQKRIGELEADVEKLRTEITQMQSLCAKAAAEASETERGVAQAEEVLASLRDAHSAVHLRSKLAEGDHCPVCDQRVAHIPADERPGDISKGETSLAAAKKRLAKATAACSEADKALATKTGFMQTMDAELQRIRSGSSELEARLSEILGGGDPGKEIARREKEIRRTNDALVEAGEKLRQVEAAAKSPREAFQQLASRRRRLAGELIKACTALSVEVPSVDDDAEALAGACKRAHEAALLRSEHERAEAEKSLAIENGARARKIEILNAHGLGEGEDLVQTLAMANRSVGALSGELDSTRAAIKALASLKRKLEAKQKENDLYRRLVADFGDSRFPQYLLNAQKRRLSALGSEKLHQLTGRYRFDDDGNFQIFDTVAAVVRSPDTLSGGEIFLASLALALAMAEAVGQRGSELSCFFLDEGFGSLDAASLDLALDGIENLAGPGRVIGLISHVPTIQARLEDLIVLDKAADGSTLVMQSEGPIGYGAATI